MHPAVGAQKLDLIGRERAVIPGMRSIPHVESNIAAGDAGLLTPDQIEILRAHRWVHDWYH